MTRYRVIQVQQMVDWFEAEADNEQEALRMARVAHHEDRRWHFDTTHELIREYVELEEGQDVKTAFSHYNHCQRKSKYPNRAVTMTYIDRRMADGAPPLEPYECKLCGNWHMAKVRADGSTPIDAMELEGARS